MLVKILTADLRGVEAYRVVVEVDARKGGGMPGCKVVGRASPSVSEGKVRVRAALLHLGYTLEARRVTVNLAPAELRKDTAAFDLPIALGILGGYDFLPAECLDNLMVLGELSLDGIIRPVNGVLPAAYLAKQLGVSTIIVPTQCGAEAAVVAGLEVRTASHLSEVIAHLRGQATLPIQSSCQDLPPADLPRRQPDLADVKGQAVPKRALEIAAAGGHNLLMVGPPGTGKSMLARRLPTILPAASLTEAIETTKVYSVAGLLNGRALIPERPFRAPHHTVSVVGLVGGGPSLRPGELSLAHNGVLFLDELLEFPRPALEALRQPLEDRQITITRARGSVRFPADIQLVAAMNPCPCGHRGDPRRTCTCSNLAIARYWHRLSGPLIDRIDLLVEVPAPSFADISSDRDEEPSVRVSERVTHARLRQQARTHENDDGAIVHSNHRAGADARSNARLRGPEVRRYCRLDPAGQALLETASERLGLSGRAINRVLKVSRTIADLAGAQAITPEHLAESLAYRQVERLQ